MGVFCCMVVDPVTSATVHFSGTVVATCSGQRRAGFSPDRSEQKAEEGGLENEGSDSDGGLTSTSCSTASQVEEQSAELWDNRLMIWSL